MTPLDYTIENMTLTAQVDSVLDLDEIAASLPQTHFDPEKFQHIVFKLRRPRATLLIYQTGKIICVGVKSTSVGQEAIRSFLMLLQEVHNIGTARLIGQPKLRNVVAVTDIGLGLDLDRLSLELHGSIYEPEMHPGLLVRMNGSTIAILWGSGKAIFTGVRDEEEMSRVVKTLRETVPALSVGPNIDMTEARVGG